MNSPRKTTEGTADEYEKELAEQAAKIKVGLTDSSKNDNETWEAEDYKQYYTKTLRGMKSAGFKKAYTIQTTDKPKVPDWEDEGTVVEPPKYNVSSPTLPVIAPQQHSTATNFKHVVEPPKKSQYFTMNVSPLDISRMYLGKR